MGSRPSSARGKNVENDARFGKFFSGVRASIEMAWIRPRMPHYIRFQAEAGGLVERYCRRSLDKGPTIEAIAEAGNRIFGA